MRRDVKYVKSSNLVMLEHGGNFIVYNKFFGNPNEVNDIGITFLNMFSQPASLLQLERKVEIENVEQWIKLFIENKYLLPVGVDELILIGEIVDKEITEILTGKRLSSLGLLIDTGCNLDCTYCLSKKMILASSRDASSSSRMLISTAKNAVDKFIEFVLSRDVRDVEIYFGGSEPFLNWPLIKLVVEYCNNYDCELNFSYSTNTNGTLVTPVIAEFIRDNNLTVTTSLDGPIEVNDKVRRFNSGEGTYERIMAGWKILGQFSQKVTWFCLTLTDDNIHDINESFFDQLHDLGIESCSIEPDIIQCQKTSPDQIVEHLMLFKKMGMDRGISIGGMWDKPIKNMFEEHIESRLFNCSAFTGRAISVLPSGDIIPCSYSATKLGKISNLEGMFSFEGLESFIRSRAIGIIKECSDCEIEGLCVGGCYITPEYCSLVDSDEAFNYRCDIYRKATRNFLIQSVQ